MLIIYVLLTAIIFVLALLLNVAFAPFSEFLNQRVSNQFGSDLATAIVLTLILLLLYVDSVLVHVIFNAMI